MDRKQLIKKYLEFFKSKDHKVIPSASLIPENDPTVLFVTAGMHPLVPYLQGEKHPLGKRLVNVQKCIRTKDIEKVGDKTHHTFFEMLGNWSLGDYWKKEAIKYSFEFLTKKLKIPKEKLAVTVFAGDDKAPIDEETKKIWGELLEIQKIILLTDNTDDNWWGPAGKTGPCGPDTEIFYWKSKDKPVPNKLNHRTFDEEWVEIWNDVFMEYNKKSEEDYKPLKQKNVDTGMGVERTIAILNGLEDNYMANMFKPIIEKIEKISKKKYSGNEKSMRIIADHIKAAVFIIADGITPGNTGQEYVLRRLIRRAVRYGRDLNLKDFIKEVAEPVFKIYEDYSELKKNKQKILEELEKEEKRFLKTLERGVKILKKESDSLNITKDLFSGKTAFLLYQTYGFPIEMTKEILMVEGVDLDIKGFEKEQSKHQELSRTATKGKFKAGLADHSEQTTKLHTATHLLHATLKKVLGKTVEQRGSNITPERLRFDFTHSQKMTEEEKKKVEDLINNVIKKKLAVNFKEMPYKEAVKKGAESFFRERYPEVVKVYSVGDFSKEICAGPHVKNTGEIGKFKIIKETSSSAGIRRIKAVVG